MVYISDYTLEQFIKEDIPYIDLTTLTLDIAGQKGRITFECREDAVICGTEEVIRLCQKLNVNPINYLPSGTRVAPHTIVAEAEGNAENLHMVWKVAQNILEYTSGIATRTASILAQARKVNPSIALVTTRKVFPGTKELAIKAVIAGGGLPHRLGLSESILIFEQHLNFLGGWDKLVRKIDSLKAQNCEKKIIVEVTNTDEAIKLTQAGIDGVQFDKMPWKELQAAVRELRNINPNILILAAGGINEANAADYAQTGVNALVTSAAYFGKPVDYGVNIVRI